MHDRKIKVLCFYRFHGFVNGKIETHTDSVIIFVDKSSEIRENFETSMRDIIKKWNPRYSVGPKPYSHKLVGWLSENGMRNF